MPSFDKFNELRTRINLASLTISELSELRARQQAELRPSSSSSRSTKSSKSQQRLSTSSSRPSLNDVEEEKEHLLICAGAKSDIKQTPSSPTIDKLEVPARVSRTREAEQERLEDIDVHWRKIERLLEEVERRFGVTGPEEKHEEATVGIEKDTNDNEVVVDSGAKLTKKQTKKELKIPVINEPEEAIEVNEKELSETSTKAAMSRKRKLPMVNDQDKSVAESGKKRKRGVVLEQPVLESMTGENKKKTEGRKSKGGWKRKKESCVIS